MIPKVIHYCWFGNNKLPDSAIRCINSWKEYCPDYKIIEWNESNYDVKKNKYMYEAYKERKWAFVSDYARLDIIYENGGIYMDTDVELLKPLDEFLNDNLFCGWESIEKEDENFVNFGLGFGAHPKSDILRDLLDLYDKINFINEDGSLNLTPCTVYQTMILKENGLDISKRGYQKMEGFIVYPETYFSPKSFKTGRLNITSNTVSIHHFSMTWHYKGEQFFRNLELNLSKKIGEKGALIFVKIISLPYRSVRKVIKIYKKRKRVKK